MAGASVPIGRRVGSQAAKAAPRSWACVTSMRRSRSRGARLRHYCNRVNLSRLCDLWTTSSAWLAYLAALAGALRWSVELLVEYIDHAKDYIYNNKTAFTFTMINHSLHLHSNTKITKRWSLLRPLTTDHLNAAQPQHAGPKRANAQKPASKGPQCSRVTLIPLDDSIRTTYLK